MATAEKQKTDPAEPRTKTSYVVLQVADGQIIPIGTGEGLNDIQAIGEVAAAQGIEEGEFVAVPARSWRVRKVAVQTRRSVTVK